MQQSINQASLEKMVESEDPSFQAHLAECCILSMDADNYSLGMQTAEVEVIDNQNMVDQTKTDEIDSHTTLKQI